MGRWGRRILWAVAVLGVVAVVVHGAAYLMLDRATWARSIWWRSADTGDIDRFPQRVIRREGPVDALGSCSDPALPDLRVRASGSSRRLTSLLGSTGSEAFVVLSGDCVAWEWYADGTSAATPHTSFSVAKSVDSLLVGAAVARGDIGSVDDPVTRYVPELRRADPRFGRITLAHLMSMTSGLHYVEHGLPWSDDAETYYSPDLRSTARSAKVEEPPGRHWLYDNYNPLLMGLVLERATGMSVPRFAQEVLWGPLGAERDASWSLDSRRSGFAKMESGFNAVARDYARLGLLVAHDGRVGDRQVLPRSWIDRSTSDGSTASSGGDLGPGYAWWWWVDRGAGGHPYAMGNHGQFVYVDRERDVVVVRLGRDYGISDWPVVLRQVAAAAPDG